jgi:hypothetical protein
MIEKILLLILPPMFFSLFCIRPSLLRPVLILAAVAVFHKRVLKRRAICQVGTAANMKPTKKDGQVCAAFGIKF